MANQGIYKNPIFLNSVTHKSVNIAPVARYPFAKGLNSVVIVGQEFLESAKHYPIVFTKTPADEIIPVVILGLRNNENLFVDEEGNWRGERYIPAFFRRYPFILVANAGQDGAYSVCVDSAYEGFDADEGMPLFDEEGNTTDRFKKVIEFLKNYNAQHEITKDMIRMLQNLELFKDFTANITLPAGEKIGFSKLLMVDETAMFNLEDEQIVDLFRKGYLAWIYAHLYSLSNFRVLMNLAGHGAEAAAEPATKPAAKPAPESKPSAQSK
jgi:hypothetical protein